MLAENCRTERARKDWNRNKLQRESGVRAQTIFNIEKELTKNPGIFTVQKIARALGVTLDDLVGRENNVSE